MKKYLLILLALVSGISVLAAQPRAVGVKLGWDAMVSLQTYVGDNDGFFQVDLGTHSYKGLGGNVTWNWCAEPGNWAIYYGMGVGAGYDVYNKNEWRHVRWDDTYVYKENEDGTQTKINTGSEKVVRHTDGYATYFGLVGSIGVEYILPSFPLSFGIEYQPLLGMKVGREHHKPGIRLPGESLKWAFYERGLYDVNLTIRYHFD